MMVNTNANLRDRAGIEYQGIRGTVVALSVGILLS
jgi:hypothetical protein